jgi:FMN phosphatase YigB (HAD superfamily)
MIRPFDYVLLQNSGDHVNDADGNPGTVFLFDVDNTLLDNDRVANDLKRYLADKVGEACSRRYWDIFEQLRTELGYADYLGALQGYRVERPGDPKLLAVSHFMVNYPFANRLFPESLDAVEYARQLGRALILSDGDVVFQPLKIDRSGLYEIFEGHVLIYIHKELELDDVEARYPAAHYIMVDDKVRILAAIKKHWGARVTTVFPRQGHYAMDAALVAEYPKPDITLERIGELQKYSREQILAAAGK